MKISGIIHASHKLFKMEDSTSALDVLPQNCTKNVPKPAVRTPAFHAVLRPYRRMADKGRSARADRPSPHFDDLTNRRPFSARRAAYFCCAASFAFSSFCIRQAITTNAEAKENRRFHHRHFIFPALLILSVFCDAVFYERYRAMLRTLTRLPAPADSTRPSAIIAYTVDLVTPMMRAASDLSTLSPYFATSASSAVFFRS